MIPSRGLTKKSPSYQGVLLRWVRVQDYHVIRGVKNILEPVYNTVRSLVRDPDIAWSCIL
jgi:hypothetical protein